MALTQTELDAFVGTENIYQHPFEIYYTDGVKYLATQGEAFWLLDAIANASACASACAPLRIASHQTQQILSQPELQKFQIWELTVAEDKSAVLICRADTNTEPVVRQEIEYTDFPLKSIKLYLEQKVLLLPSEY